MLLGEEEIKKHVRGGWLVRNLLDERQIQQCGVDLTVGKVFALEGKGVLDFSNEKRKLPSYREIAPVQDMWQLAPGMYHAAMNETIRLPNNVAGLLLPRSSALTCGIEVHSALWDPGYEGRSFIHCSLANEVELHRNARIAQMIFLKTGETGGYSGAYKGEDILKRIQRGA